MKHPYKGKLIIFTTFYRQQGYAGYIESIVPTIAVLERLGISYDYWPSRGDFHVERTVNHALSVFMSDESATDFLLIDSDEAWNASDIVRLIMHEEDIVSGSYRQSNEKVRYLGELIYAEDGASTGKMLPDGTALLEAYRVPGGFLRLRKRPLKLYAEAFPDEYFIMDDTKVYPFFWNEIKDNIFFGMDYALSEKWRSLGVQLWIDPMIKISHFGLAEYKADLDGHLRKLKEMQESDAFAVIKDMAREIEARNGNGTV